MHLHDTTQEIPCGYCHCGCGQKTNIATKTARYRGHIKGEPLPYILGHHGHPRVEPPKTKLCECGCGSFAPIATRTDPKRGYVAGEPHRFILNHDKRIPIAIRFWHHVTATDPTECWEWQGSRDQRGYGYASVNGHTRKAHQISYELHYGPIPEGKFPCHKCDNPPCCNPHHLFAGTPLDNMQDMKAKGRDIKLRGEQVTMHKLTEGQVREIRQRHAHYELTRNLADEYKVSRSTILNVVNRDRWKHIK